MKTLDEVIENAPYVGTEWINDALHYLKAFREAKDALFADRERTIEAYCQWKNAIEKLEAQISQMMWVDNRFQFEISDNPPLTWDELRQMKGKPVWVEVLSDEINLSSRWMLVARETKAHSLPLAYTDDIGHWIFGHEDKLGKTWQAYRKERK